MNFLELKYFLETEYSKGFTRGMAIDHMFDLTLKKLKELNIEIYNVKDFYRDFLIYIIRYSNYDKNNSLYLTN
tara:strand:+ start:649 stop:867 length:219 start_codon:yes stop_codon:yes gene_type:complete